MKKLYSSDRDFSIIRALAWLPVVSVLSFACRGKDKYEGKIKSREENKNVLPVVAKETAVPPVAFLTGTNVPEVVTVGQPVVSMGSGTDAFPFFIHLGREFGLPVNSVLCSAMDKAGNLWLGTGGLGVIRYDGNASANFTIAQGMASNVVFSILESVDGNLWFATSGGLTKYDGYRFVNYTTKDGLPGNFISSLVQDNSGNLWIGTNEGGLVKYDGKSFMKFNKSNGLPDNYVQCLLRDTKGSLWIGTAAGGLSNFDGKVFKHYTKEQGLPDVGVTNLLQDHKGNIWIVTRSGMAIFDGEKFISLSDGSLVAPNMINCLYEDSRGNIWMGTTANELIKYDGHKFLSYHLEQENQRNSITSILEDKQGSLWLTTWNKGVYLYKSNGMEGLRLPGELASDDIFTITGNSLGGLWLGTKEHGLIKYDGKNFSNYTTKQGFPDDRVWILNRDKAGNLWMGTDKAGIVKYDGKRFINYRQTQGLAGNIVNSLLEDSKGNLWIGTFEGVSKFDGKSFTNYTTRQGIAGDNVQSMIEDNEGDIWIATHDFGVSRFDGEKFSNFSIAQGLPSNTIYTIVKDRTGELWFGTNNGLSRFDGKRFVNYTTAQGLPDNYIWALAEDESSGRIWIGTNKGISLLHKSDADIFPTNVSFENFNEDNGYPIREVNAGALFIDPGGVLWIGSRGNGLLKFNYSTAKEEKSKSLVLAIRSLQLNENKICWNCLAENSKAGKVGDSLAMVNEVASVFGGEIEKDVLDSFRRKYRGIRFDSLTKFYPVPVNPELPFRENTLTIDFAAIAPAMPKQVRYQYLLEGYSREWSPLSNNTTAVMGNIWPGSYTFRVKALDPLGRWSELSYSFRINPPWWLAWWAYILYAMIVSGIFLIFYRSHIRALGRQQSGQMKLMVATQEEERKRIARDLHDEVGVKLSALKLSLSTLSEKIHIAENQQAESLAEHSKNLVGEAMQDVRRLLLNLSPRVLEEFGFVTAIEGIISKINESGTLHISLVTFGMKEKIEKEYELALYRISQELINNVLKHAEAKEVLLQVGRRDNRIIVMIEDDGKGFNYEKGYSGNGLRNLDLRTKLLKGTMAIDSHPGKGTSILIEIPYIEMRK